MPSLIRTLVSGLVQFVYGISFLIRSNDLWEVTTQLLLIEQFTSFTCNFVPFFSAIETS